MYFGSSLLALTLSVNDGTGLAIHPLQLQVQMQVLTCPLVQEVSTPVVASIQVSEPEIRLSGQVPLRMLKQELQLEYL